MFQVARVAPQTIGRVQFHRMANVIPEWIGATPIPSSQYSVATNEINNSVLPYTA